MNRDNKTPSESSVNRRSFFRQIFLRGVEHLEEAGKAMQERFDGVLDPVLPRDLSGSAYTPRPLPDRFLRPPGAMPEYEFVGTCSRCAKCVEVCPADAIKIEPDVAGGLPHIIARTAPCVVCDDLACMKNCPTGALADLGRADHIMMGYAVVAHDTCVRSHEQDCKLCVEQCPIGEQALAIDHEGRVEVHAGCVGCGVCERACPTEPPSIWVEPHDTGLGYYDYSD